jgi:putative salt-induced outer membrane protein YdiY
MKKLMPVILSAVLALSSIRAEAGTDGFETSLSLGVTLNQGNTDSSLGNASLLTERKTDERELRAGAEFVYGEVDGEKSAESGRAFIGLKEILRERLYGSADSSAMYDPIADVKYRAIAALGIGYFLIKDEAASLSVDVGPAYVWEKVGGATDDYLAIRFAERYDRALSDTAKVWQSLEYIPEADDFNNYLLMGEVGVEAALNTRLSLRLVYKVIYDNEPAPDTKKSDRQLVAGLVVKL